MFSTVHLVETEGTAKALRALVNSDVDVTLTEGMPANTGHHHAPLVAWVSDIEKSSDMTAEYGTAATTVRGFYEALGAGSGDEAARFIVPERRVGPFAPEAMSAFYGNLIEPLRVVSLQPNGPNRFLVRYHFRSRSRPLRRPSAGVHRQPPGGQSYMDRPGARRVLSSRRAPRPNDCYATTKLGDRRCEGRHDRSRRCRSNRGRTHPHQLKRVNGVWRIDDFRDLEDYAISSPSVKTRFGDPVRYGE